MLLAGLNYRTLLVGIFSLFHPSVRVAWPEVRTDGEALIVRPAPKDRKARVRASAARMMRAHDETLRKLAKVSIEDPEFLDIEDVLELHRKSPG